MSDSWTLYPHPGKFEGEHVSVPHFWESALDGADDEAGGYIFVKITTEDRAKFPELGTTFGLSMFETDSGFVNVDWYKNAAEYDDAVKLAEELDAQKDGESTL